MREPHTSALLTDLYQLTMLAAYHERGMNDTAVFEFFVRKLPAARNFLVAAGLEQALAFLEGLRFAPEELDWLKGTGRFRNEFVERLAELRFTGDVDAMPEGSVFFPDEPILRVTAPLMEAQLVETRLINLLQFQTLVASKAVRCVIAAQGRLLVDFGLRRAHGAEAGLLAARAAYLAGFGGSSAVLAGALWDIPLYGTMAHSFVQAHDDEMAAFEAFARVHPANCTMLIDTYDTEAAARRLVALARSLAEDGIRVGGVRLDSGDLAAHARAVRDILDAGGCRELRILASGNLDEHRVAALVATGAPIDGFGVGTRMNTSADAPYLDCAYKLEEYAGVPRRKRSEGKATWPGRKQVWRHRDAEGTMRGDLLGLADERAEGEPLIEPVMRGGRRVAPAEPLARMRQRLQHELTSLPAALAGLDPAPAYPVEVSAGVRRLAEYADARVSALRGAQ